MKYLIGVIGPSGSGKSRIMIEALKRIPDQVQIIKSDTTRARRDEMDNYFYNFVTKPEFLKKAQENKYGNIAEYADNFYGSDLNHVLSVLKDRHGMFAVVEPSIPMIRERFPLKLVRIDPVDQLVFRSIERTSEDGKRSQIAMKYDAVIKNSFKSGGLEESINQLISFITSL